MSDIVRARVEAADGEPTSLDFLDQILTEETEAKQRKRDMSSAAR